MKIMLEKIEKLLTEKGLRQTGLERAAGLPANRVAKWKAGQGEPTARQLWRISRVLQVPLEYLLDDAQAVPGTAVSVDEAWILDTVRQLGFEAAKRRLLGLHDVPVRPTQEVVSLPDVRRPVDDGPLPPPARPKRAR